MYEITLALPSADRGGVYFLTATADSKGEADAIAKAAEAAAKRIARARVGVIYREAKVVREMRVPDGQVVG